MGQTNMEKKFYQSSERGTYLTPSSIFVAIERTFDLDVAHPGWSKPEDGSVATEPPNGIALIGVGERANTALSRCGLGWFVSNRSPGTALERIALAENKP